MPTLTSLDYTIVLVYAAIVIGLCWRVTRRAPDMDELFLAGRSLGPAVIGLSLFASNISSTTLIGLPGAAWEYGIAVANYEWMAALVLLFTAVFVAPVFIKQRITTVPEILERRFDSRLRKYLSGTSLFLSIVLDTAGSLYAGALVLMLFVPGLSLGPTCAMMALFAGLYTAAGGLRAVVYTDVLQALVLLVGSLILTIIVFQQFDFSWTQVVERLDADHLSLIRPLDDPSLPWLGTLIGLPILGFYYWTMNQYVAQRLLGARSADAAAKGAMLAAALKLLPLFIMVLPGAMAAALFTDLERADTVFPRLIAEFAPAGLAGLMVAGLLAAIMSSVDSTLNSASTLLMVDFVRPRRPDLSPQTMARWGRYSTIGLMIFAALWAPAIDSFPGLFAYLQQTFSYVVPPLVAAFAVGFCSKRVGAWAALRGVIIGHLVSLVTFVAAQLGWHSVHFSIVAGLLFFFTLAVIVLLQYVPGAGMASSAQVAVVAQGQGARVSARARLGIALVTAMTVLLVIAFW
ncbi:MAG: sodium/solute symporter [Gammaproteobacteria bacterium]|uniref:sodium:solute symporter family transporter n=1 Tax=Pseudomaricurvus alcaniphilus TaxID=1166482 RepID=UPI00140D781B|nr:sodium/solute symporter [Pseudomaricurvus alcaniphilus]MBR9909781.1 sodium/solute symporter [Gammaproteobacteria bacterium]NHN38500.1 sodium/solute symporter [Pseudomaricurvus alcaniphilus]